jgi:pyruvate dehydrogenase E1 component alpha subunit/2-oxoisovalerate dehydrogenase E1 component
VIKTYRLCHHSKNDDNRPVDEVNHRWAFDPLAVHRPRLRRETSERIDREVIEAIRDLLDGVRRSA